METLFILSNLLVLPFWFLMMLLPGWHWTQRIMRSLWVVVPTAALYTLLLFSQLASASAALMNPTLGGIAALLGQPAGATVAWVHLLTFDLFAGRWAYLDGRERGYTPWLMSPILFFILMTGPLGFLLYLTVRTVRPAASS
jgi:hypothetical protein